MQKVLGAVILSLGSLFTIRSEDCKEGMFNFGGLSAPNHLDAILTSIRWHMQGLGC